ncbi:MAG: Lrp/AsnC family transcriptional regulator [Alphaproteobacteria bacterium]
MRRAKLDKIDKKILKDLQADGRITNVELARNVGISAPPCLRRVRTLEESGYIKSYHAKISPVSLGYNVTVFAQVKLISQAEADLRKFEQAIVLWPLVRECHLMTGDFDYLLKVVAKDWDSYQRFMTDELTKTPLINSIKSSLTIRPVKDEPGVPIDD